MVNSVGVLAGDNVFWGGFFAIENINLSDSQWQVLLKDIRGLAPVSSPQPASFKGCYTRADQQARIFEVTFAKDAITLGAIRIFLANVFAVDPGTLRYTINILTFDVRQSVSITFIRSKTDYVRVLFFGYAGVNDWPDKVQSEREALAYMEASKSVWNSEV